MKLKFTYFAAIAVTILSGIFVRAKRHWFPDWINLWLGDLLYAFMMYFIVALLVRKSMPVKARAIITLIICYCIELSQLYRAECINMVRATMPGRLVLGNGFLLSDLIAYTAGVAAALCVDMLWINPNKTTA